MVVSFRRVLKPFMPGRAISAIIISGLSTLAVLSRVLVVLALPIICSPW